MKISVVTVAYNSSATIGETVRSFLEQTHREKEMVVIDGASTDDTVATVEAFGSPDIRIFSEKDAGPYDAMNKGLARYTGDAVGILNSDDTFHGPDTLARIAEGLAEADIAYGDVDMVGDHITKTVMRAWKAGAYRRGIFRSGWMPPHPTFYARRAVIDRVKAFDTSYRIAADYDLMMRAMELTTFRVQYVPSVLVDFQLGGISSRNFRATVNSNLESLRARRANLGAPPIDAALFLRPLRKLLEIKQLRGYYKN